MFALPVPSLKLFTNVKSVDNKRVKQPEVLGMLVSPSSLQFSKCETVFIAVCTRVWCRRMLQLACAYNRRKALSCDEHGTAVEVPANQALQFPIKTK